MTAFEGKRTAHSRSDEPLGELRHELQRLMELAGEFLELSRLPAWQEAHAGQAAEHMGDVRRLLSAHISKGRGALVAELLGRDPALASDLADMRQRLLVIESDFSALQALLFAYAVGPNSLALRRRATKAARSFQFDLDNLRAMEEERLIERAERILDPAAMRRVRQEFEAQAARERMKWPQLA